MKKIKSIQIISILVIGSMILFSSCKKNSDTTTTTPANGSLMVHLHTNADTNEVANYGDTLVLTGGRRITVTMAQMYLSGFQLVKSDGSVIAGPSINVLKVMETEPYVIGSVASGNYNSIKFNIGLSSSTNASTPSVGDPTLYVKPMWLDTNAVQPSGFVFVVFQGTIDTAATPSASNPLIPFSYRIGTNAHLQSISMPNQAFTVFPNQASMVHMIVDYAKLFTGVTLSTPGNLQINTAADNALPLATQVANNVPSMFTYE